jgi:outer membrane protein
MRSSSLLALLALPAVLSAQTPASRGADLSLDEAIRTAQNNNPLFQRTRNALRNSDYQVKQTRGALLPTLNASAGTRYTQGGTQYQFGLPFENQASINSSYSLSLNYNVNAGLMYAPKAATANRAAAEADITANAEQLRAAVTQQYITALQSQAQAEVLDTLVEVARGQLELATAKMQAGAGTIIDVRSAEVSLGQAQVTALNAHNTAKLNRLQLFQTMGVPGDAEAKLTTKFAISQPSFSLDTLLDLARRVNPDLAARKSREIAAEAGVKLARTRYLPSLNLSTGYQANALGYTDYDYLPTQAAAQAAGTYRNCVFFDSLRAGAGLPRTSCGSPTLTADQLAAQRSRNKPLQFNRSPLALQAFLSIPIFDGFTREANIESNKVQRDDAALDVRARNLQINTDVTQAYLTLVTQARTVELQTQIAAKAAEDLALNEASFRVGARTFLDVSTARGQFEKAQIDRVNAIYEYHKAFAALENAIGRPLR